jgi:hypothetical protein
MSEVATIFNGPEIEEPDHWPDPIPLIAKRLPEFPVDCLPRILRTLTVEAATAYQVPLAMAGVSVLGALSTATQRFIEGVRISPDWLEKVNLYLLAAMESGTRKSPVVKLIQEPFNAFEALEYERLKREVAQQKSKIRGLEKMLNRAEGGVDEEKRQRLVDELEKEREGLLVITRFFAQDTTPEQLAYLLKEQGEMLTIFSAEGEFFEVIAGRYTSNGSPNIELVLKCYTVEQYRVDRRSAEPLILYSPSLTIMIAVQPEVLKGLASKPGFKGKGLLARFLFAMPQTNVGYREINPQPINETTVKDYHSLINGLLSLKPDEKIAICLTPEAKALLDELREEVERAQRIGGDFEFMQDWALKYPGGVVRIAANLHAAKQVENSCTVKEPIGADTMREAIAIGDFFRHHSRAAYGFMEANEATLDAKGLLERLKDKHSLKTSDLWRSARNKFGSNKARFTAALKVLEDHKHIRIYEEQTGGRPSDYLEINPKSLKVGA